MSRLKTFLVIISLFALQTSTLGIAMAQDSLPQLRTSTVKQNASVFVNGQPLSTQTLSQFTARGIRIPPGRYWYDAKTGAWGLEGQGVQGLLPAGLRVGGTLKANASNGRTGIFINGRQLAYSDVAALRGMGVNPPAGRYWCRADGACGREGSQQVLINLRQGKQKNSIISGKGSHGPNSVHNIDGNSGGCFPQAGGKILCFDSQIGTY